MLLSTAARNAAVNAVVGLIDVNGPGTIQIGTTGLGVILATLTFSNPAFGSSSSGTAAANSITPDTNTVAGTAAAYNVRDGNHVSIFTGSVGTSSTDIVLNSTTLTSGGICSLSSLTVTQPAS